MICNFYTKILLLRRFINAMLYLVCMLAGSDDTLIDDEDLNIIGEGKTSESLTSMLNFDHEHLSSRTGIYIVDERLQIFALA